MYQARYRLFWSCMGLVAPFVLLSSLGGYSENVGFFLEKKLLANVSFGVYFSFVFVLRSPPSRCSHLYRSDLYPLITHHLEATPSYLMYIRPLFGTIILLEVYTEFKCSFFVAWNLCDSRVYNVI